MIIMSAPIKRGHLSKREQKRFKINHHKVNPIKLTRKQLKKIYHK